MLHIIISLKFTLHRSDFISLIIILIIYYPILLTQSISLIKDMLNASKFYIGIKHNIEFLTIILFGNYYFTAFNPAIYPDDQAHCKLNPPQSPSISNNSPTIYNPLTNFDSKVLLSISFVSTPPAVTCA